MTAMPSGIAVTVGFSLLRSDRATSNASPIEWAGIMCMARTVSSGASDT